MPLGVIGIIYEARPNVTVDAAGLCLKCGNAVLLRGSSSAPRVQHCARDRAARRAGSSRASGRRRPARRRVARHGQAPDAARGLVDVLIPRGGAGLIRSVVEESTVPVIETGVGNCHVYVDAEADLDKALEILVNSKTQRRASATRRRRCWSTPTSRRVPPDSP